MKRLISSILLLIATLTVAAQCRFETAYPFYLGNYPTKTITTSDGNFLTVTGAFYDTIHPGGNNGQDMDMVIIKTDACGKKLWQTHYGYAHEFDDACDAVETDNGDYLVLGEASWQQQDVNIRIASYSKDGLLKWAKLYLGAVTSFATSIHKVKNRNTYVVAGARQYSVSFGRPTLFEINDTGKVLRFKDVGNIDCGIRKLFVPNDTSYLILGGTEDSLYLIETDTAFNLRRSRTLFTDTFGKMDRFYAAGLSYDGQSIALAMEAPLSDKPGSFSEDLLVKINLQGDLIMYKIIEDRTLYPNVTFINARADNGYLIGAGLRYTDSNFNTLKYQEVDGKEAGFYSAVLNTDGSVTLSGETSKYDTVWGNVCVVRVDSLGNTAVNDLCEKQQVAFEVYPNPATDVLNIHTESKGTIQVELLNAIGQSVYKGSFRSDTTIATAEYPQGVYFLRFMDDAAHTMRIAVLK